MAISLVLAIIAGCAAFQYLKGTIFKALTAIIIAICASIVAFGYFETLAGFFISKAGKYPALIPWVQPLCFTLLFILAFAILQTAAMQLAKKPVDFGDLPEQIGRIVLGILLGFILSGLLLTALAMAPLPYKYPYQRFDPKSSAVQRPNKVALNPDGFTAGWFSIVSSGSLRAIRKPRSFAALHPEFLDQLFLNRLGGSSDISLVTAAESIFVPTKKDEKGAWYAPGTGIKDTQGKPVTAKSNNSIIIVRMGIWRNHVSDAGKFTPSQLRLICKQKDTQEEDLIGKAINVYPMGYFSAKNTIQMKKPGKSITVRRTDFTGDQTKKYLDFAFEVPNDHTPILLEFKLNCIVTVPRPVPADQAPPVSPFVEQVETGEEKNAELNAFREDEGEGEDEESPPEKPNTSDDSSDGAGLTLTAPTIAPPISTLQDMQQ